MLKNRISRLYESFKQLSRILKTYSLKKYNLIEIIIIWAKRKLTRFQFLVLSGIIVGALGGLVGITLNRTVHYIYLFTIERLSDDERIYAYGIYPVLGIILTTLVARYIYKEKEDIKLHSILEDIKQNNSNISRKETNSRVIMSAITVGLGGSAGLETPMAITGAAIGSNFGQHYRLGYKEKTLLLAGGAAAGIASAFSAPIAGIMFSFEMLLVGVVFTDFIPLVIASMCGSIVAKLVLNEGILFNLGTRTPFNYSNLPYYILLGILSGFYARYFIQVNKYVTQLLDKFPYGSIKRALLGGIILGGLCMLFPALYSQGYVNIVFLKNGEIYRLMHKVFIHFFSNEKLSIFIFLIIVTLLKAVATSATLNSGGVGGNFAPSLIAGGLLGYTFGYGLNLLGFPAPTINLMLVGMAGTLSGVLYAPLTAIFLIAEASSGYDLFIPLMLVSVISFLINKYFSPVNPVQAQLAEEGKIYTTQHDQNILTQIPLEKCMDENSISINYAAPIEEVMNAFKYSDKSIIAVVGNAGDFFGMIRKEQMIDLYKQEEEIKDKDAASIAYYPNDIAFQDEDLSNIILKFEITDTWYLPLVDKDYKYLGFVSRFQFLKNYRRILKDFS